MNRWYSTLFATLFVACAEDVGSLDGGRDAGDAGRDAGAGDSGPRDVGPDATPTDATPADASPDAGPRDGGTFDAGPDDSLAGTSLAHVAVEWAAPLELCNRWMESRPYADEAAAKVHVSLPVAPRGLGRVALGSARFRGVVVRTSPLSAGLFRGDAVGARVARFELSGPANLSTLSAEVHHDLGPGGTLLELYSVFRSDEGPEPVSVDALAEVAFAWARPGAGPETATLLEPCGGSAGLRPMVHALVAEGPSRAIVIYRFLRSIETFAGSYAVNPSAHVLKFSDRPWEEQRAEGLFSYVYSAQHHNWDEESSIDFTRDLGHHETVFEPLARGEHPRVAPLARDVHVRHAASWDTPLAVDVTTVDPADGSTTLETFTAKTGFWRVVDGESARRSLEGSCATEAVVTTLLGPSALDYAFHVLSCAGDPGPLPARAIVVAGFLHDPAQIGERVEERGLEPITRDGRSGVRFSLGGSTVELTRAPGDDYVFGNVADGGGASVADALFFAAPLEDLGRPDEVLRLASADGAVRLEIVRRWAGQGVGESSIYAAARMTATFGGATHVVEAWDRLDYTNTHHNWLDALEGRSDALRLVWGFEFLGAGHSLTVTDLGGAVVLPKTALLPAE